MVIRKKKSPAARKAAPKKKGAKKTASKQGGPYNLKAQEETLNRLKKELKDAWDCFCRDARKKNSKELKKDAIRLKLAFGECGYMANECKKYIKDAGRKKR